MRVTRDIDALIEPSDEVEVVVAEMAADLGLPSRWLNAAGSSWLRVEAAPSDEAVTIAIASERELIAMKMSAARDKDFVDLGILARHLGITDPAELVRIAYDIYGDDAVELPDGPRVLPLVCRNRHRRGEAARRRAAANGDGDDLSRPGIASTVQRSAWQENPDLVSDLPQDVVDGAGDVRRGRHAEEHDRGDDVRERGGVTGVDAVVAAQYGGDRFLGLRRQCKGVTVVRLVRVATRRRSLPRSGWSASRASRWCGSSGSPKTSSRR